MNFPQASSNKPCNCSGRKRPLLRETPWFCLQALTTLSGDGGEKASIEVSDAPRFEVITCGTIFADVTSVKETLRGLGMLIQKMSSAPENLFEGFSEGAAPKA